MIYPKKPMCQLHSIIWKDSIRISIKHKMLNLRAKLVFQIRNAISRKRVKPKSFGAQSRFSSGTWVRILDEKRIRETLDSEGKLRGLYWSEQLWPYCGSVHQVLKPVRRMLDDTLIVRPISGTVLLDTATCGGVTGSQGCGRECPMMFRDEWLEEVQPQEKDLTRLAETTIYARIRDAKAIKQTLDASNSCQGLMFMPEMYEYAGKRFPVLKKVDRVWGPRQYLSTNDEYYLLEGLYCSGTVLGDNGPCERGCRLLWHKDWLDIEE
jgi:hypothetical protein